MPFQWLDAKLDHRSINPLKAPKLSYKAEALAQTMNCTV